MGDDFDPDKFLVQTGGFDPSTFLGQTEGPVLDAANTGAFHAARHLALGLGDKIMAGEQGLSDWYHDKTGKVSVGDAYRRNLAFNDRLLEASDTTHPVARWVGNGVGVAGSLVALAGASPVRAVTAPTLGQLAGQGAKLGAVLGGVGGFGASRADSLPGTVVDTAVGSGLGAALGGATPYLARYMGGGARYLGDKAKDLAGWFKVHSLHPSTVLSEAMDELPGGGSAVGKELLERGLGGLTKKGTAAQIEAAKSEAGQAITELARVHDATGGNKVNLTRALLEGWKEALAMKREPTTEAAGKRLWEIMDQYETKYSMKPITAAEALALKRTVAKAAYGAADQLRKTGDVIAGNLGQGLSKFERAIDEVLDQELGPGFEAANLTYRRLLGATEAAEKSAAKSQGSSHLLGGLVSTGVAGAAAASGHTAPESIAAGLGSTFLQKYGSQAGARLLYSPVAGGLNLADAALGRAASHPAMLSGLLGEQTGNEDLVTFLRRSQGRTQ